MSQSTFRLVVGFAVMLCVVWMITDATSDLPPEQLSSAASEVAGDVHQTATFAGGCFWCMEPAFDKVDGVISTTSGYIGGRTKNPTYAQVKTGRTGHIESMRVRFDPDRVSYESLVSLFWHNIDPTQANGQFCDKGNQYRSVIFTHNEMQEETAKMTRKLVREELGKRIETEIMKAGKFYAAEEYHQDYYKKNPTKYKFYRWKCGRDARLDAIWGQKARQP